MKSKENFAVITLLAGVVLSPTGQAMDLKQAKFTQIVNQVQVISSSSQSVNPAAVNEIFKMPDVIRTGTASRAELVADDDTVTRIGASTIFSFDPPSRTIDLQRGSLLFHSPHGRGGGTICAAGVTAAVLGTTFIVSVAPDGAVKVLDLEGRVAVRLKNRHREVLRPGEMILALPDGRNYSKAVFDLAAETKDSLLVNGFSDPLPSLPLINDQIAIQEKLYPVVNAVNGTVNGAVSTVNGTLSAAAGTLSAATAATTAATGSLAPALSSTTTLLASPINTVLQNPVQTLPQNSLPTDILPTLGK